MCVGKCKVQLVDTLEDLVAVVGDSIDCSGKNFCMLITTRPDKEQILLCAPDEASRTRWINAVRIGRTVTHANMVKLAVENRVLADDLNSPPPKSPLSSLAIFSNRDYIQKTPIAGGAEGWLRTAGFRKSDAPGKAKRKGSIRNLASGMFAGGKDGDLNKLKKRYCILRDSHLLIYEAGDALVNPRGIMSLVGSKVEMLPDEDTDKNGFKFRCISLDSGDFIDFTASSDRRRRKWAFALKIGAHVTFTDFKMLMSEHNRLARLLQPEATAPVSVADAPEEVNNEAVMTPEEVAVAAEAAAATEEMLDEDDESEQQLDAGEVQAYDQEGNVVVRNPDGTLLAAKDGDMVAMSINEARFSVTGVELDAFNRPLPQGAVAMFTKDGQAIGVGPDKKHYLADGTEVAPDAAHFDRDGAAVPDAVVAAGEKVAEKVVFDLKVKAAMARDIGDTATDALGRTLREKSADGKLLNKEGVEIVPASARLVKAESGQVVNYEDKPPEVQLATLGILVDDGEDEGKRVGEVEVDRNMTLADVRNAIKSSVDVNFADFVFITDMSPLLKYEEKGLSAQSCLPEITIRGRELKAISSKPFSKKVAELHEQHASKEAEKSEFEQMMQRVRAGKFLKPTRVALLE